MACKHDVNRNTELTGLQRIVRKDQYLSQWQWKNMCIVDLDLATITRVPLEIQVHQKLLTIPDIRSFVNITNTVVDLHNSMYRMYLEYCPFGDLSELRGRYQENGE